MCICDCVYLCMQCEGGGGEERVRGAILSGVTNVGGEWGSLIVSIKTKCE